MKLRHIIILTGLVFPVLTAHAQYAQDALRFSQTGVNGTARFQAMGGVNTALGADVSSVSGNPAGLGFFRKSEWSFSPALSFAGTNAAYRPYADAASTNNRDSKVNFNIANMGVVFASPASGVNGSKWRGGAFGISYSRINSFQNRFTYRGFNDRSSFTDFLADQAYRIPELNNRLPYLDVPESEIGLGVDERVARAQMAYLGYLIDPVQNGQDEWESGAGKNLLETNQQETVESTGSQSRWNLSYGGNVDDKFFFGASLGLSSLRYGYENAFTETIVNTDYPGLLNLRFTDFYDVSGSGINGTIGAIYKPNDLIRLGASVTTPTYYWNLREEYRTTLNANFDNVALGNGNFLNRVNLQTVTSDFDYQLTTPLRASFGVAIFAGKNGFVSADAEYVAYPSSRVSNVGDEFNTEIQNIYKPAVNARIGGEYRAGIFRVRAGTAYFGDPYDKKDTDKLNRAQWSFTGGAGFRLPGFYVDLALVHSRFNSARTPYSFQYDPFYTQNYTAPTATVKNAFTNAVLSFGTFF